MTPVRVALADDHEMFSEGLAVLIDGYPGLEVVGKAHNGMEAMTLAKTLCPDVLVLDYSMPDMSGQTVVERLQREHPSIKIIILTMHDSVSYARVALEAGAKGYLLKSRAIQELLQAIESVHRGETYITAELRGPLLDAMLHSATAKTGIETLSQREFQLLHLLSNGNTMRECARQMCVGDSTASTYRKRIMEKLNLTSTADIIRFAIKNNITAEAKSPE